MAITDIFSKRQKILRGEAPRVYVYDPIPDKLRNQVKQIIEEFLGNDFEVYEKAQKIFIREQGVPYLISENLYDGSFEYSKKEVLGFLLKTENSEEVIDVIELVFRIVYDFICTEYWSKDNKSEFNKAISELNKRFKEHGIGYCFEGNQILRIDSSYMHSEITKPTIELLYNEQFNGANEEYLKAHEHYKKGNNKECLNECLKAFESTMKIICREKNWNYDPNRDTASKLIEICLNNHLIPLYVQNQFTSLRSLFESGVSTIRNRNSGHGQGHELKIVDDEIARYALNLTAANIIFLIEQSNIM